MSRRAQAVAAAALLLAALAPTGPKPRLIGEGVISTPVNEFGGMLGSDGRELFFSASVHRSYMYGIYVSRLGPNGAWSEPQLLPFSGHGRDFDLVFAPGGRRAYFVSDRPLPGESAKAYNAWRVERRPDGGWGEPVPLPAPINRPSEERPTPAAHEWFISEAADGTLYLTSADRKGGFGAADIWRVEPQGDGYAEPVNLGPAINTAAYESEAVVAPDESFMLFSAYGRPDGHGDWDIYITHRAADGGWSRPVNLGAAVNTPERDYSPRLAPDGRTLLFTSERYFATGRTERLSYAEAQAGHRTIMNGYGNIYAVDLTALPQAGLRGR